MIASLLQSSAAFSFAPMGPRLMNGMFREGRTVISRSNCISVESRLKTSHKYTIYTPSYPNRYFMRTFQRSLASSGVAGDGSTPKAPTKIDARPLRKIVDKIYMKSVNTAAKLNEKLNGQGASPPTAEEEAARLRKLERCKASIELSLVLKQLVDSNATITDAGQISYVIDILNNLGVDYNSIVAEKSKSQSPKAPAPAVSPRLPYLIYRSSDALEIRVGRKAEDNDVLSCDQAYRDDDDWWFHVAGSSGSHVVIRSHEDGLPDKYPRTLREAAYLAAINSKAPRGKRTAVTCTRCKYVSKAKGDPPGMVRLDRAHASTVYVHNADKLPEFETLLATKSYS